MTTLEAGTELFDLFGQEGSCSICMEDLAEGDRCRALRGCDHLFHATCVEPWLLAHGTCPMCRATVVQVQAAPAALSSTMEALQTVRAAVQGITGTTNNSAAVIGILAQIETLLGQTQGNLDRRRRLLTYCIAQGIAGRFPTAEAFNTVKGHLSAALSTFQFENVAPFPLSCSSLTVFKESYKVYYDRLRNDYPTHRMVRQIPDLMALGERLRGARANSQFLRDYWRTD